MDESYVCTDHVYRKIWSDRSQNALHAPITKGERLIIIHAGGEQGFVPNALAMWKAGKKTGDHHENMENEKGQYLLIPNLQPHTILVIDNANFHNKQIAEKKK